MQEAGAGRLTSDSAGAREQVGVPGLVGNGERRIRPLPN